MHTELVSTPHLDAIFERYVRFLAIPYSAREASKFKVQTKEQFAQKYSITISDLSRFESRDDFQDRFMQSRLEWARSKTPELLELLYAKYKKTQNSADLKLWLEITGELKQHSEQNAPQSSNTTNILNVFTVSDEQKKSIIARAARRANLLE